MTPTRPAGPLSLFAGFGIEIEYAIVDRETFEVRPLADRLLREGGDGGSGDVERGAMGWSNELVAHLVELKTVRPVPRLAPAHLLFQAEVRHINSLLARHEACLLPGGMHPFMDPRRQTVLWPHGHAEVYGALDRIFDCRTHGWANLQSMQLNLPFSGDEEFGRLLAAVRLLLPLMPALSAASPWAEGCPTGFLDTRMETYRTNALRVPEVTGEVIPEQAYTRAAYEAVVFEPLYAAIAPLDPDRILAHEWLNARGAIARFDRDAIEIRVLDAQECPAADLAVAAAVTGVLRGLVGAGAADRDAQKAQAGAPLVALLGAVIRQADEARVEDAAYLRRLGCRRGPGTARQVWRELVEIYPPETGGDAGLEEALALILEQGPLARRLAAAAGPSPARADLVGICARLAAGLEAGRPFDPRRR